MYSFSDTYNFFANRETSLGLTTLRVRVKRPDMNTNTSTTSTSESKLYWKPWKRKRTNNEKWEKLLIPLPIPHPVHIAIMIFNRDSDLPIAMESDLCWDILKSIEDCYGDIQAMNCVARYRGGGHGIDSSMDSLGSQSSRDTKDSIDIVGGSETLPCTNRSIMPNIQQTQITITTNSTQEILDETLNRNLNLSLINRSHSSSLNSLHSNGNQNSAATPTSYHWTLSNLNGNNQNRRRINSGSNNNNNTETIRVDLASPEDISLETDSSRVVFSASAYGTTV